MVSDSMEYSSWITKCPQADHKNRVKIGQYLL